MSKYVLFEPGGRQISGYSYGKLVERRYIDIVPAGIESSDRDAFVRQIEALDREYLSHCRVGHVDENGAGKYFDPLEFLENDSVTQERSESLS